MASLLDIIASLPADQRKALALRLLAGPTLDVARSPQAQRTIAETATGMLPGAGDVMAAQDSQAAAQRMAEAFRSGDYGKAFGSALESFGHGLGALPLIPAFGAMVKAFHGSPHRFDRFDMNKIGTGEGAQAYGYGLYFAENPAIAGHYKSALSHDRFFVGDVELTDPRDINAARSAIRDQGAVSNTGLSTLQSQELHVNAMRKYKADVQAGRASPYSGWGDLGTTWHETDELMLRDAEDHLERLRRFEGQKIRTEKAGSLYNVALDVEPEDLLDWDAPLSQQPPKVKETLRRLTEDPGFYGKPFKFGQELPMRGYTAEGKPRTELTGGELYKMLASSDAEASRKLAEAGIPGLRYFDAGSRGSGEGTRNVVMFRDDLIKIEGVE